MTWLFNMISYSFIALISVVIFALVHLYASKTHTRNVMTHGKWLSFCGGVAIAYVFIDLLPKLCQNDVFVKQAMSGMFPYFERHVYIMALGGFLLFFSVDRAKGQLHHKSTFWLSLASYALFNFFVGYAVVDKNNPEVKPLALFTFAMALHYFVNDYTLHKNYEQYYSSIGKWILIVSLFLGWLTGFWILLPQMAVALISAFIGGGIIMNTIRHELPKENPRNFSAFLASTIAYTTILLFVGT